MTPSEIGREMRKIPSTKRDAAVRANAAIARSFIRPKPLKPCACHVEPHKSYCPVYMREYQRAVRVRNKGKPRPEVDSS